MSLENTQNPPAGRTGRIATLDVIKGFLMVMIVGTHVVFLRVPDLEAHQQSSLVLSFLYLGLMLFFIISGYLYRPERSARTNIMKRLRLGLLAFVIQMLVLPVLMFGYMALLGNQMISLSDLPECWKMMLGNFNVGMPYDGPDTYWNLAIFCGTGAYFVFLVVAQSVLMYLIAPKIRGDIRLTALTAVILLSLSVSLQLINIVPPFYQNLIPLQTAFMLFGMVLKDRGVLERMETEGLRSKRYWISMIASLGIGALLVAVLDPKTGFNQNVFGDYGAWSIYPFFVEACIVCYGFLHVGFLFSRIGPLTRVLRTVGKHSLAIILVHVFIGKLILAPFFNLSTGTLFPEDLGTVPAVILAFVIVAIITLLAEYVFPRFRDMLLEKLPFGNAA